MIYRFVLQAGVDGAKVPITPIYKDSTTLDYVIESRQRFYRKKLSGKLTFLGADYNLINNAPFETEFILTIEKSNGGAFVPYFVGHFYKTDCSFDYDNNTIEVSPDTLDEYNNVLDSLNKKENIIKLTPEIEPVNISKRPLLQIYSLGDVKVTNYLSGITWEDEIESTTDRNTLVNRHHFALCSMLCSLYVAGVQEEAGFYTGELKLDTDGIYKGTLNVDKPNGYYIKFERDKNYCNLKLMKGNIVYSTMAQNVPDINNFYVEWESSVSPYPRPKGYMVTAELYARYILDVEQVRGKNTYPIEDDDPVIDNKNYNRAIGYALDVCNISNKLTDTPTEYGRRVDGKYYLPPARQSLATTYYPIARSQWKYPSYWFSPAFGDELIEKEGRKKYLLLSCYPLSSIISSFLKKYAPNITHEPTAEYSEFLYGGGNPISYDNFKLFITAKSNILVGEFGAPATKAESTLGTFLDALRKCFALYWFIDGNKLRIEHISWFKNGGSYSGSKAIGYDLTRLKDIRNNKPLSFGQNKATYRIEDMPERYEYKWMDDVSAAFEGVPIEIRSKYVQAGKKEEINIAEITTDVDYMLMNPSSISMDGFAMLSAQKLSNGYEIIFKDFILDNVQYEMQNGILSFPYLQKNFLTYDLPSRNILLNNLEDQAKGISRDKQQEIRFPAADTELNPNNLIHTSIGDGEIEKISVNLSSRNCKATLKYDTE